MRLVLLSFLCVLTTSIAIDGFHIERRTDEVPDDLIAQFDDQLIGRSMSGRISDAKKSKKVAGSSDDITAESTSFECGITPVEPNVNRIFKRIIGGVEAVPHSWPWTVSLQQEGLHGCGGSLINDRWVVSAAHCRDILNTKRFVGFVVIGLHDFDSTDATLTESVGVEKVIVHPNYLTTGSNSNDIMLIKLARPVEFNTAVQPVCLPQPHQTIESGTRCWTTGWGHTGSVPTSYLVPSVLNQVNLPIIDNEVCNQPEWYNNTIDNTMICAGYEEGGRDFCVGDNGGPLVCHEDGKWILYGIASWGKGCAGAKAPGIYVRTSAYSEWIDQEIRANSN